MIVRTGLGENMEAFITNLGSYMHNWQIIVANSADGCHNNDGSVLSEQTYPLDQASGEATELIEAFTSAVRSCAGSCMPWTEALTTPAALAVEKSGPGQCNEGFLRPEALLHVVLVSDETEQSPDRENWDGSFTPAL